MTHCKHVGDAYFDRPPGLIMALGMLESVGIVLWGAVDVELLPAQTHHADEGLYFEPKARNAHNASCRSAAGGELTSS